MKQNNECHHSPFILRKNNDLIHVHNVKFLYPL